MTVEAFIARVEDAISIVLAYIQIYLTMDWGLEVESAVRSTAKVLAFVYTAGYVLGEYVHQWNSSLSELARKWVA